MKIDHQKNDNFFYKKANDYLVQHNFYRFIEEAINKCWNWKNKKI